MELIKRSPNEEMDVDLRDSGSRMDAISFAAWITSIGNLQQLSRVMDIELAVTIWRLWRLSCAHAYFHVRIKSMDGSDERD